MMFLVCHFLTCARISVLALCYLLVQIMTIAFIILHAVMAVPASTKKTSTASYVNVISASRVTTAKRVFRTVRQPAAATELSAT